jgi:hypothetical protein
MAEAPCLYWGLFQSVGQVAQLPDNLNYLETDGR